jgi:hypothetical protein
VDLAARALRPCLVRRAGQQLAAPGRRDPAARGGIAVAQRLAGRSQEIVGVRGDRPPGEQLDAPAPQHHGAGVTERLTGVVRRLAQIGRTRPGVEVRPELLEDAIADEAPTFRDRQEGDQLLRAARGPVAVAHLPSVQPDAEAAEQLDRHVVAHCADRMVRGDAGAGIGQPVRRNSTIALSQASGPAR